MDAMTAVVASRYRDRGLPAPARTPGGRWLLDTCPPSLQFPGAQATPQRIALRPEPHRAATPAHTTRALPPSGRPRVLVTFGTHFTDPTVVVSLLRVLAEVDVDLLATLGVNGNPHDFDVDPQRVELAPFVPLAQLLDGVAAVVTHGGAGTTLGALARGIPLIVVPQGADQFIQADRVAASGAGLALPPHHDNPDAAAHALRQLLTDSGYTAAARRIRDEIAAMPSPAEVAQRLQTAVQETR